MSVWLYSRIENFLLRFSSNSPALLFFSLKQCGELMPTSIALFTFWSTAPWVLAMRIPTLFIDLVNSRANTSSRRSTPGCKSALILTFVTADNYDGHYFTDPCVSTEGQRDSPLQSTCAVDLLLFYRKNRRRLVRDLISMILMEISAVSWKTM